MTTTLAPTAPSTVDEIDEAIAAARNAVRTATTVAHRQACERYLDYLLDQRAVYVTVTSHGPR